MNSNGCNDIRRATAFSRRALLQAGGCGMLGGGLASLSPSVVNAATKTPGFGTAKRCIFLFMWGGPSQLDTLDMKPEAPAEVRGEFNPIATSTPGVQICEHFKRLAKLTDKTAIIRSLSHSDPAHLSSGHATVTGHWAPVLNSDKDPPSDRDTPHLGAMMARLQATSNAMPSSVIMPWKAYHPAAPGGVAPGQHGGWLGTKYDPLLLAGDPNAADWQAPSLQLLDGMSPSRLADRREMLRLLDLRKQTLDQSVAASQWNDYQEGVASLLTSPRVTKAFDLSQEADATRDRYGRNIHGQCVLLARRLVEQGVPVVNVNWHNDGKSFWDTHGNNFNRLKDDLIPPADQALSALVEDLEERGMLDDTIVAWVGEFGRKPQVTKANAGREHWPRCYSGLLAGGGIRGGMTFGTSDKHAAYPASDPVSPLDYAATIFHAMGVDTSQALQDREGRPHKICSGRALQQLFV